MTAFFTSIILVGSGITLVAFFLILSEKHRLHDYRKDLRERKNDLINVIEDAEVLISEMNKFSDYAVSQIEEKHNQLKESINVADSKIEALNAFTEAYNPPMPEEEYNEEKVLRIIEEDHTHKEESPTFQKRGKILTFDLKRREIIKLSKSGLDCTEIARLLNCGKGEIELISKLGR